MSKKQAYVEEREFLVKEFLWVDGNFECSSGELLNVLHKLSNAEYLQLTNQNIINYLSDKQLLTETDKGYTVNEGKAMACVTLGNNISRAIDKKLASVNPDEIAYVNKVKS